LFRILTIPFINFFKIVFYIIKNPIRIIFELKDIINNSYSKGFYLAYKQYFKVRYYNRKNYTLHRKVLCEIILYYFKKEFRSNPVRYDLRKNIKQDKYSSKSIGSYYFELLKKCNHFSSIVIEDFYYLYLFYGRLTYALEIRLILLQKLIKEQENLNYLNIKALQAALELGEYDYILNIVNEYKIKDIESKSLNKILAITYLVTGDIINFEKYRDIVVKNTGGKQMMLKLSGKSIAVLGPLAEVSHDKLNFDLVAASTLIYNDKYFHEQIEYYGYYNHSRLRSRFDDIRLTLPLLGVASFKNKESMKYIADGIDLNGTVPRILISCDDIIFHNTGSTQIPNIIFDLFMFNPKRIKLFGSTIYASKKAYRSGYKNPGHDMSLFKTGLRIHDPFFNFAVLKIFFSSGLLETDEITSSILSLTSSQYSKKIDYLYGDYNLIHRSY